MSNQTQDYIDTLTLQRNAALDEIARMSVIIRALQRQIATPTTGQNEGQVSPEVLATPE
jgi:hypothetical protein